MVGGRDYGQSQFNRVTQALRQPGSAFKAFVYLSALEAGLAPDSTVTAAPVRVPNWTPDNYNGRYFGDVPLREHFARSRSEERRVGKDCGSTGRSRWPTVNKK